ncbi:MULTISPECIES: hypothetical protein [unclassified Sporolactobacillus]|uniref:hypothetical protein n=1 Tax=unclassified Sporolactobacillus TaxID=2628533 RepID=UPI002368CD41|nr:hypothetical protein [Sporolactobacillus sp. CQH2019]MDD9150117.1 hypothetical protein [Sporolactobacillus sp. CQH2019]
MPKHETDAEQLNKRAKSADFDDEEFAQPLDEHSIEEKERAQRTGNDSISETKQQNK